MVGARAGEKSYRHGNKTKRQISGPHGSCHSSFLLPKQITKRRSVILPFTCVNTRLQIGLFVTMQVPPPVPSFRHSEQQPVITALKKRDFRSSHVRWIGFGLSLAGLLGVLLAHPAPRARFLPGGLVTLCFAAGAWMLRGVTLSGAVAGFLATLLLFVAAGPPLFGAVLLVFVLTYGATRFGRGRKQSLHIAERPSGRDAAQILATIGFAALFAA